VRDGSKRCSGADRMTDIEIIRVGLANKFGSRISFHDRAGMDVGFAALLSSLEYRWPSDLQDGGIYLDLRLKVPEAVPLLVLAA